MLSFASIHNISSQKPLKSDIFSQKNQNSYDMNLITEKEIKEILFLSTYFPEEKTPKSKKNISILV